MVLTIIAEPALTALFVIYLKTQCFIKILYNNTKCIQNKYQIIFQIKTALQIIALKCVNLQK